MKRPEIKKLLYLLLAVNLTVIAFTTYILSDPLTFAYSAQAFGNLTPDGTWFVIGVILSPLFYRE